MHLYAMFNAYPDSVGENLEETAAFLSCDEMKGTFRSFYILPTVFNTDLDGGFSVISYDLCGSKAREEDLRALKKSGIDLSFDFILNHLSALSPQFRDILKNGDASPYRHFFIDWNRFWEGRGEMTAEGYILPDRDQFDYGNLRKKAMPLLCVPLPDGKKTAYWNTFYQQVVYPRLTLFDVMDAVSGQYDRAVKLAESVNRALDGGKTPAEFSWNGFEDAKEAVTALLENGKRFMGQMDVNVDEPAVWEWYGGVMDQLASYGAAMIRLDAFARLHKAPQRKNFINEPETWEILTRLREMAAQRGLEVLPEIHAAYSKGYYRQLARLGCMTYDYFLPALLLDAIDMRDTAYLHMWAQEIIRDGLRVVNMLGCHDGIPMRDVRGLLPDERVDALIGRLVKRGGHKKIIHGATEEIYQMNIAYYSALECDDRKLLLARAVQLFMPGKPQVWYMDLLAGASDEDMLRRDPGTDTREVNRRRYSLDEARERLRLPVVREQLRLLKLRNTHPAFAEGAKVTALRPADDRLTLRWEREGAWACLEADFTACAYQITHN